MEITQVVEQLETEIKILRNDNKSLRENNKLFLELLETQRKMILQFEPVWKALRSANINNLENYTYAKELLKKLEKGEGVK